MDPVYESRIPLANKHQHARWFHGKISRADALVLLGWGGFLVRELTEHVSYELLTSDRAIRIWRQASSGSFKVNGIDKCFDSVHAVVAHFSALGLIGPPRQRLSQKKLCSQHVCLRPPSSPPPKRHQKQNKKGPATGT